MKQVVLIDSDGRSQSFLEQTILSINDQVKTYSFPDIKSFYDVLKISMQPTSVDSKDLERVQKEYPLFDFKRIVVFIADLKDSEKIPLALWKKLISQVEEVSEKAGEPVKPKLIFTSHEDTGLSLRPYYDPKVLTIISKPFDDLLIKQFIQVALSDEGAIKTEHLFTLEKEAQIEIVKDIEIERITELGFTTISSREIDIGKKARYFGPPFKYAKGNSLYAYCYACIKHPEIEDKYRCSFAYFGVSQEQVAAVRKKMTDNEKAIVLPFVNTSDSSKTVNVLSLLRNPENESTTTTMLKEKFTNVNITWIEKMTDLAALVGKSSGGSSDKLTKLFPDHESVEWTFNGEVTDVVKVEAIKSEKANPVGKVLETAVESIKSDKDFLNRMVNKAAQIKFKNIGIEKKLGASMTIEFKLEDENVTYVELLEVEKSPVVAGATKLVMKELTDEERKKYLAEKYGELKKYDIVFIDELFCVQDSYPVLREILSEVSNPGVKFILLSERHIDSYDRLEIVESFDDLIPLPLDLFYFTRKLKMHNSHLKFKSEDDNSRKALNINKSIKTALPATIKSVSESHLTLLYERALKKGEYRRFILWIPGETNYPEIDASCYFTEKHEANRFKCDFLFTGVNDSQLKYIRRWIKLTYVQSKK